MTDEQNYIYRKIYNQLKRDILDHKYKSHEKLLSKRALAKELNVSINSVKTAYEQLIAEGYIYTKERQGYYIESLNELIVEPHHQSDGNRFKEKVEDKPYLKYTLSHMSTNLSEFPIETWTKLQKQVFKESQALLSEVPYIKGPLQLRQSIAKLVSFKRGITCDTEQIIVGSGTNALVLYLLKLFDQSSVIGIENPGYTRMRYLIQQQNFEISHIPLDNKGASIQAIKKNNPHLMLTIPSHQFPIGTIMPISRRIELLNWATSLEHFIIEDDYDSEYKYGTDNIPSLFSLDKNNRVIYLGTFSKTLLPGLRISYMILPEELVTDFEAAFKDSVSEISTLNALTLSKFIDNGYYERYIRKMSHLYEYKRKKLVHILKTRLSKNVTIKNVKAGLHFVIYVDSPYTYEQIETRANNYELELYTLDRFMQEDISQQFAQTIIIGFANVEGEKMNETVEVLDKVLFGS
ncbi:PLP-dependent aminotransferase family protein [Staphylococcus condimenti]|uniref:PLP-dependent aminotransferase family protein n=1 Tax=Staphylococcus condimenti TaxID=70255 RepID=A0A4Q7CL05_9STAP|nr:PLP-dependent aminotransferase family protein [Staphylococcus condimenti]RZI01258.1 PLP-dependent aminotransferase family protein [Staphylococcus condimenti]RZI03663.1 PLP-dependent aminotransferase family protein [Staphylococcus condimenti]